MVCQRVYLVVGQELSEVLQTRFVEYGDEGRLNGNPVGALIDNGVDGVTVATHPVRDDLVLQV